MRSKEESLDEWLKRILPKNESLSARVDRLLGRERRHKDYAKENGGGLFHLTEEEEELLRRMAERVREAKGVDWKGF